MIKMTGITIILSILFTPVHAEPLKIASWNLEWLSNDLNKGKKSRSSEDYELLAQYAEKLDADIIAVQEVEGKEALRRVFDKGIYNYVLSRRNSVQKVGFVIRKGIRYTRNNDFTELNTTGGLRHGVDITVKSRDTGKTLRLLAVHLKSGCFSGNYRTSSKDACRKLRVQVPVLESWIDDKDQDQPYLLLGDFNRRLAAGERMWKEIDDGQPANADLTLHTQGLTAECYNRAYPKYIDHIITDLLSSSFVVSGSFKQLLYSQDDMRNRSDALPDHCPISLSFNL